LKRFFWIIFFIALIGGLYFAVKTYFPFLVSNFIPVNKEVKQFLPLNSETQTLSPFKIQDGYRMDVFADLRNDLPRVLAFDDNGNLIVSLTSKGKIAVLADKDLDLKSESKVDLITGLNRPHGIALDGNYLYVAETDGVSRYLYNSREMLIGEKELLFSLPAGGRHYTRTIVINDNKLYTSVGSSCDVCVEENPFRASILVSDLDGKNLKIFAKGLRNTVFFSFDRYGKMWGADMGRDGLGDSMPPEEINIIEEGGDYGWPYCYSSQIQDVKFSTEPSVDCGSTIPPIYEMPAHTAPLGFVFDEFGSLYVALHGSWNSTDPVGYKVVKFSTFAGGVSDMQDFLTGFLQTGDKVLGRPAGLVFDKKGNLYISDDKTGLIYIITK
jgi:glucose/arabinose dehydrogenase